MVARNFAFATMLALFASSAMAQSKPEQKPIIVAPAGATVQPLGNGAIIRHPNQPDTHVQPLGNSVTIRQQGKPDVRCYPVGNQTVCR